MNRIKNLFIGFIYAIYIQSIFYLCKKKKPTYCIILAYHSIQDDEVGRFKQQMQILKRLTTPIALDYDGPFDRETRYSIVTFDDAYESVIRNAVPEMTKMKIPFTVFIPVGCLGTQPGWLKNTDNRDTHESVSSADEISKLPADIAGVGSHTVNHLNLISVDDEKADYEIKESKIMLETQLNTDIKYFAFPYGNYDPRIKEFCREAGYKQTFSLAHESPLTPLRTFVKGRVITRPSDWEIEFKLKILGGYCWRSFARSMRKMLTSLTA